MLNKRPDDLDGEKQNLSEMRTSATLNRHSAANQKYEQEDYLQN
jgi:hypothetical protein